MNIETGYCACGCRQKTRLAPCSDISKGWIKGQPLKLIRGHKGYKWPEESKEKIKGRPSSLRGTKRSKETIEKMKASNKVTRILKVYNYVCNFCNIEFKARQKDRKFCSKHCYEKGKKHILMCDGCGISFYGKAKNVKYCHNCKSRKCLICGNVFVSQDMNKKYCSSKCYHDSTIGKEPWNKDHIDIECQFCGQEFSIPRRRKSTAKYCSRDCKHNAMSEVTGPDHPLWKGGFDLYGRMLSQNAGSFYRNRIKVLDRDNNACCHCGHQGKSNYMDVHHIIPVRQDGSSLESNMLTLCRKCHNRADRGWISKEILFGYIQQQEMAAG